MIASQRKAHKFIWLGITVLMAALLFFTLQGLELSSAEKHSDQNPISAKKEGNMVNVSLNRSFVSPSAVVYGLAPDGKPQQVLGQLKGVGEYHFEASKNITGILVMDEIKDKELVKIEF